MTSSRSLRWHALLLAVLCVPAHAATNTHGAQIAVLADAAGDATAQSVLHGDRDSGFRPLAQGLLRAPNDRPAWYRVQLSKDWDSASAPLLAVTGDVRARLVVYLPPAYAARPVNPFAADLDPRFSRHALVFELPRDLRAGQPVYLELGAPGQTQPLGVRVVDYARYQIEDLHRVRVSVFLASLQVAMLLVILCFWLVLRDRVFLYFIGYVVAQLAYQLAANGELYVLPGARLLAPLGFHPGQFAAIVSAGLSISFILAFADLAHHVPRLARVLSAMRWPYVGFAVALWLPPLQPDRWLPNAVNAMLVISTFTALVTGWRAWRRGSRQAGFFLISWLPLLCLTVLRVAQLLFGLPLPTWLAYGFPASMAYAAVVITVGLADRTLQARRELDLAHRLAEFDPLTGVLNRRAILARLRAAFQHARQTREPLAVLFLDLDHFKQVNDNHGHRAGDQCLTAVIDPITGELREHDTLGRYGGEEFLVVLPATGLADAQAIAERIRVRVQDMSMLVSATRIGLTLSVGIAALDADVLTVEDLIERADTALYRSKSGGRNRVSTHPAPPARELAPGT